MSSIFEQYSALYKKLKEISDRYDAATKQLDSNSEQDAAAKQLRIEKLKAELEKIDEYSAKIESFRKIAEKNIKSKNLLTITPRELNFNRMREWATRINPFLDDDPYAQRIYVLAKCNEMMLAGKKASFEKTIKELESVDNKSDEGLSEAVERVKEQLLGESRAVVESKEFLDFVSALNELHSNYTDSERLQTIANTMPTDERVVGIGGYALPFPVLGDVKYQVKAKLPEYFDSEAKSILLPVELPVNKENVLAVACAPGKEKRLYRALQNYLLQQINAFPAGDLKVYLIDPLHYNKSTLGPLGELEGTIVVNDVPENSEAVTDTLKQIVSSFSEIDDTIGIANSVLEYNQSTSQKERLARTLIVLVGYPDAFPGEAKGLLSRIFANNERYGISILAIKNQYSPKKEATEQTFLPFEITEGITEVRMLRDKTIISVNHGREFFFRWYELRLQELTDSYKTSIKALSSRKDVLGTEYINRVDMDSFPPYERGKKSIVLPYGIDSKDEMHSISFDNENFASYLMGASGSGKSTLLHTLITGILRNYHPDDVELWLADFKMSEFAQYIDPLPPHVKYILLDESPELVYDLLDQLTEKMMERQRFFMKHRDMKKVENVPSNIYMPVIFVILDEFSIMSQAVSESEVYKLRLQNLLAKGRALGIKFIFSSQTFTKGIAGLTQTAKDQIQTRIAMKNSYNEINETLELSSGTRTEQVKNWMEALPPHFTLSKYRDGDRLQVKRLQVMYFKGKGDEALEPQRRLIRHLNSTMHKVNAEEYDNSVLDAYVDKKPVIVDGNSYKAFNFKKISALISEYREANRADLSVDDTVITFGAPRRMVNAKFVVISNESRENLLLIARGAEQACGMSIALTAMKSFVLQGGSVQVWAYNKNRLYRAYKDSHLMHFGVAEGMSEICAAISEIRGKISQKELGNELIVMLGMEQICNDFDLIDFGGASAFTSVKRSAVNSKQFEASSEEDIEQFNEVKDLSDKFREEYDLDQLEDTWLNEGKSFEEIESEEERLYQEFLSRMGVELPSEPEVAMDDTETVEPDSVVFEVDQDSTKEDADMSYNASEDFKYIVKQGSRFGYHFMLCLNDLSDLKATQLQQELFRHKLVFQVSADDSIALFASKIASRLPEHICQYSDTLEQYSLRPFIHEGVSWDGWDVDSNGEAINSILE